MVTWLTTLKRNLMMVYHPHHVVYHEIVLEGTCRKCLIMVEKERGYLKTKYKWCK